MTQTNLNHAKKFNILPIIYRQPTIEANNVEWGVVA